MKYWQWVLLDLLAAVIIGMLFAFILAKIGLSQYSTAGIVTGVILSTTVMSEYKPKKK
mgnify:CR=1 FL=1